MTTALIRLQLLLALVCQLGWAQNALQQAVTLTRERHYADAHKLMEGVPEPAQLSARIAYHRLRAAIASGLQEHAAAADEMNKALALSPSEERLRIATAVAEIAAGRLDAALKHVSASGKTPEAQMLIGDIQEKRGEFRKAVDAYQAAVQLAPDREQYRMALGFELIRHQAFRPAIEMLQQSATVFPKSAAIRTLLGIAQYSEGFPKEAIGSLNEAIRIDPHLDSAYRCLAQIVLESSAAAPAPVVQSLCAWNAIVCSSLELRTARENHDAKLQEQSLAGLQRASVDDPIGQCELARAYEWSGDLNAARPPMERCVKLNPSPQNHYRLGLLYGKLGLSSLAHQQMTARNETLRTMSEQTAQGLSALQHFEEGAK